MANLRTKLIEYVQRAGYRPMRPKALAKSLGVKKKNFAEFETALEAAEQPAPLAGRHVLITAGPTREALDPVRYLSNRSSGRMGFALARAAARAGARVSLVAGPVTLDTPPGVERVDVESAADMREAVTRRAAGADIFIAAAAVADYRPKAVSGKKLKKNDVGEDGRVELARTPDILAEVAAMKKDRPYCVGFAAETDEVEAHALAKLEGKKLDLIAANRVGPEHGFDRDDNELLLLWQGGRKSLGRDSKAALADALIREIAERIQSGK
jgi:phosphopantothenoylcysteine decarboxylase/phosphopantothenate--cysteine ligase